MVDLQYLTMDKEKEQNFTKFINDPSKYCELIENTKKEVRHKSLTQENLENSRIIACRNTEMEKEVTDWNYESKRRVLC